MTNKIDKINWGKYYNARHPMQHKIENRFTCNDHEDCGEAEKEMWKEITGLTEKTLRLT